jgi:hypothetical protein
VPFEKERKKERKEGRKEERYINVFLGQILAHETERTVMFVYPLIYEREGNGIRKNGIDPARLEWFLPCFLTCIEEIPFRRLEINIGGPNRVCMKSKKSKEIMMCIVVKRDSRD